MKALPPNERKTSEVERVEVTKEKGERRRHG